MAGLPLLTDLAAVVVSNHEHEPVSYTLVVELQELRNVSEGPNTTVDNAYREVHLWINVTDDRRRLVEPAGTRATGRSG